MEEISLEKAGKSPKPERCVFVISIDENGKPNGMVAGWHTWVSEEPTLIAVSLGKEKNTLKLIKKSKEFVIAVPNKEMEKEVEFFGSTNGEKIDKFKETGIETTRAKIVKSPLLTNATFNYECKLEKEIEVGDCILLIGRVVAAYENKGKKVLLNMGKTKQGKRVFEEFNIICK